MKNTFFIKVFTLAIFLIMAFFVANYALAADDNAFIPICAADPCDTNLNSCDDDVGINQWTSNGYPDSIGNRYCCGDDSSEYYTYCKKSPSLSWACSNSNNGCCSNPTNCFNSVSNECVVSSYCSWFGTGNDQNARCMNGTWVDPDDNSNDCLACVGYGWGKAGEANVGEYTDTVTYECCRDDVGENYIHPTYSTHSCDGTSACCNSENDYVYNSTCVTSCPDFSLSNSGAITVNQIGGVTQDVAIAVTSTNSFNANVTVSDNCSASSLSCTWPDGSSCTPPVNSSCTKILRVGAGTATVGPKTVVVTGTASGYTNKTTSVNVTVNCGDNTPGPESDFSSTTCNNNSYGWGLTTDDSSGSCWSGKCCGDDSGENYITSSYYYDGSDNSKACCNSASDCVDPYDFVGNRCVAYDQFYDNSIGGNPLCKSNNEWEWCDRDRVGQLSTSGNFCCTLSYGADGYSDYWEEWLDKNIALNNGEGSISGGVFDYHECSDLEDNDCDGKVDCADADCSASCNQPPTAFSLVSPANNATMVSSSPTLTWSASSDPESQPITYNVYYCCAATAGCTLPVSPNFTGISGTSRSLSGLTIGYYCNWNVVASDGTNQTISTNGPFTFRVDQSPNTPSNPSPANSATCVATNSSISWSGGDPDVGDTVTYTVYGCSGDGCNPTAVIGTTNNTSYTGAGFTPGTIIRWKIKADDGDSSVTGPVWQFTTTAGTPVATITDNAGSCTNSDTLTVSWSGGTDPWWGYSADGVCNAADDYSTRGNSTTVSTTHSDYVCFKNSNTCATGYSPALGPLLVDTTAPSITSVTASYPQDCKITFTINGASDTGCAGLATNAYSFNGGTSWQGSNYLTVDVTTAIPSQTINAGQIKVRDSLGNTYTYNSPITGTANCPVPTVNDTDIAINPGAQTCSQNDPTPQITISDADGVTDGRWNNCTNPTCDPGTTDGDNSPFVCNGATPCTANINEVVTTGSWKYCARGKDNLGNWSSLVCSDGYYNVDKTRPVVDSFIAEGASAGGSITITTAGEKPTIKWTTTDADCGGFDNLQLWRTDYNATNCNGTTMTGCSWSNIWTDYNEDNSSIGRDDLTVTDTGDYWYGIHVRDNVDNCSLENNVACGSTGNPVRVTMDIAGGSCTSAPGQPTGLAHTANTTDSITWAWSAPTPGDSPDEYRIYNSSNQLIGVTTGTTYVQTKVSESGANLSSDTLYTVYVVAVNSCGSSPASASASAYTSADPPASCSGSAVSSTEINWSWVSGGNESEFYASNSAGNSNWIPGLSWAQSGLTCGTSYTTSLKARNHDAEETVAVQCSATTSSCSLPPSGPITADFQWCAANTSVIIFIDQSTGGTGGVTGWTWNFGDSQTCLANCNTGSYNGSNQYPVHEYSPSTPPDWANENWVYRQKITFDNSGRSALTNFPALIKKTSADAGFWAHVQNDGDDIRFFDSNNTTELYYEIEKFNYAGKELVAWVKVPQIDGTNTDHVYLYYGNAATGATAYKSPTNVWDTNYKMVWHMNDASGSLQDSTSNNLDSSAIGGATYSRSGLFGTAVSLAGGWQASYIQRDNAAALRQYPFTWEITYNATSWYSTTYMVMQDIGWRFESGAYPFEWQDENEDDWDPTNVKSTGSTSALNTWYHGSLVLANTGDNRVKFYRNGSLLSQGGGVGKPNLIGAIDWGTWYFNYLRSAAVTIDEIRISAGARSADWLAFQYCNMTQTCTSYSAEENGSPITDYSVVLTARDADNNTDQSVQTVTLDPVNHGCAALGCDLACYTPTACTTSQCDNNANGYRYRQTRDPLCLDNCHCPTWSPYQSCQDSFDNCPNAAPYNRVDCYTGLGCNTAVDACTCSAGYEADSTNPGSCRLEEFDLNTIEALGSEQLSLTWEKQEIASEYRIYRDFALVSTEPATGICNASVCSFTDVGLTPGTTYRYDIFAVVGGSGIYNSTVLPLPVCHGSNSIQCPQYGMTDSVVKNFTISSVCGQLTLGWDNINLGEVTGYRYKIYKGNAANSVTIFKEMAKDQSSCPDEEAECLVCPDDTARCSIIDKEVVPKATYHYKIVTINEDGDPSYEDAEKSASSYCYEAPGWEER